MANTYTGSDAGQAGLNITEVDGSPNVFGVSKIIVSNGTLTDDGAGSVTITTGGGGGGSGTVTSVALSGGTTGLTVTGSPITTSGTITIAGTLAVANGGTGATTLTNGGILLGSGTGPITATAVLTNGQLLIGDGTGDPTVANLTAGTGITITNGAGSITIAASGGGGGTVTSVDTGNNLIGGPITGVGTIDLLYDTISATTSPPIPVGPEGFSGPPPNDAGYISYGWARVQTTDPAAATAFIPIWIQA